MSEVQTQDSGKSGGKHSKVKAKKASTHIDMTPMVDLAFLLLTFFMLTTTFSKPKTMEINMPIKDVKPEEQQKVPASQTMTIILSEKDRIYWYMGKEEGDVKVETSNFSANGIRKVLLEKNQRVYNMVQAVKDSVERGLIPKEDFKKHAAAMKGDKKGLIVLIKTDDKAKYKNVVDMLDEMQVTNVGRYALIDISPVELKLIENL